MIWLIFYSQKINLFYHSTYRCYYTHTPFTLALSPFRSLSLCLVEFPGIDVVIDEPAVSRMVGQTWAESSPRGVSIICFLFVVIFFFLFVLFFFVDVVVIASVLSSARVEVVSWWTDPRVRSSWMRDRILQQRDSYSRRQNSVYPTDQWHGGILVSTYQVGYNEIQRMHARLLILKYY